MDGPPPVHHGTTPEAASDGAGPAGPAGPWTERVGGGRHRMRGLFRIPPMSGERGTGVDQLDHPRRTRPLGRADPWTDVVRHGVLDTRSNVCYNKRINQRRTTMNTPFEIDAIVRVADEGDDLWLVKGLNKGWYTLALRDEPEVTLKARHADMELVDASELDEIDAELEDEEVTASKMTEQLKKYRERYMLSIAKSGKKSLNNGDPVARALEYLDWQEVMAVASQLLLIEYVVLEAKYAHLNLGARRMNCGNRIRAAYKKGDARVVAWVADRLAKHEA